MPAISPSGIVVPGRGISILDPNTIIGPMDSEWRVGTRPIGGGPWTPLTDVGVNAIAAGGGRWLAWRGAIVPSMTDPAHPGLGLLFDGLAGRGCAADDGTIALVLNFQEGKGLRLLAANDTVVDVPEALPSGLSTCVVSRNQAFWMEGDVPKTIGLPVPRILPGPVFRPSIFIIRGEWWILYFSSDTNGLVFHPFNSFEGYRVAPTPAFYPRAISSLNWVKIAWSLDPSDENIQDRTFDVTTDPRVNLAGSDVPIPNPVSSSMCVRAFPRKIWMTPFFSHSEQYGDTPLNEHAGNAIWVQPNHLDFVRGLGLPMIVSTSDPIPDINLNSTIAWWVSGADAASLETEVRKALTLPEKMVIAYLDSDGWPSTRPDWITDRVIPSVQAYRRSGESIEAFRTRIDSVLDIVAGYDVFFGLTPRFDDPDQAGGGWTVADTLACMPLFDLWTRIHHVCVFMPFSDRRGQGMSHYPELRGWARAFFHAIPERPGRYDYWQSDTVDVDTILRNKLGQNVDMVFLTPAEKEYLTSKLNGEEPPPPPPSDNGIPVELNDQLDLVATVRRDLFPDLFRPGDPEANADGFLRLDHGGNGLERGAAWAKELARWLKAEYPQIAIGLAKAKDGSPNHGGATSTVPQGFTTDIIAVENGAHWDFQEDGGGKGYPRWALEHNTDNYPAVADRFVRIEDIIDEI